MSIPEQIGNIRRQVNGYKISELLMSTEDLGLFKALTEFGGKVDTLAELLDIEQDRLTALLNALVSAGFLEKEGSIYSISDEYQLLSPDNARSQTGYISYARAVRRRWMHLADAVKSEEVARESFAEITGASRDTAHSFMSAMDANAKPQAALLSREYNFEGHRILDIGAGAGTYAIAVGKEYPTSSGVLLDLPNVLPLTQEFVEPTNIAERFDIVAADYNDALPDGPFDDIFLFAIIHQEPEGRAYSLLKRAHDALKPGGRLFLSSFFLEEDRTAPPFAAMFAVEMLVMVPQGHVYTNVEIERLLEKAGFETYNLRVDIPGPASWYVCEK